MDAGHSCQLGQLISKEVLGLVLDYIGRRHQGPGNDLSEPMNHLPDINAEIESTQRLGGLVRSYWRDASFVWTSSDSTPIWFQYIGLITAARCGGLARFFMRLHSIQAQSRSRIRFNLRS